MKNNISLSGNTTPVTSWTNTTRLWTLRGAFAAFFAGLLAVCVLPAQAAAPYVNGTYITPIRQGTIKFTPLRRVVQFGYEGRFVVDGKTYPGSLYYPRTGGVGLVWYYGTTGITAGNALVTEQPDGSYTGPLSFFDRRGNTTASGMATVAITVR